MDAQNRMTACTLNGSTSTFTYGADGLRRSMTTNGVTTYYAYDGQTMIREMQGTPGSLHATATYLTGPRGPEYRRDDTQTEPDGQGHTFGVTRWYVYDGLGSVVGEVDPLGNVTCSDKYDVYGAVRGRTGTASTAHGFVGSLGHLSDAATGLVYMRARYYDAATGRFATQDSKQNGNNWFGYVDDNPINKVDANGKTGTDINDPSWWDNVGFTLETVWLGMITTGLGTVVKGDLMINYANWMQTFGEAGGDLSAAVLTPIAMQDQYMGGMAILGGLAQIITGAMLIRTGFYVEANADDFAQHTTNDLSSW